MTAHAHVGLDVASVRAREYAWMDREATVYLNAASTGPLPQRAVDAARLWTEMRARCRSGPE